MAQAIAGEPTPFLSKDKDRKADRIGSRPGQDEAELYRCARASPSPRSARSGTAEVGGQDQGRGHRALSRQLSTMLTAASRWCRRLESSAWATTSRRCRSWCSPSRWTSKPATRSTLRSRSTHFLQRPMSTWSAGEHAGALEQCSDKIATYRKDRGAEEEDQEGAVLPRRGVGGRNHRDGDPAALCYPAVREPVPGVRCTYCQAFAEDGHWYVALDAGPRLVAPDHGCRSPALPSVAFSSRYAPDAAAWIDGCRSASQCFVRSSCARRRSHGFARTLATMFGAGAAACWSRRWSRSPARPATSSTGRHAADARRDLHRSADAARHATTSPGRRSNCGGGGGGFLDYVAVAGAVTYC